MAIALRQSQNMNDERYPTAFRNKSASEPPARFIAAFDLGRRAGRRREG
jgi:hypothetical protein